MGLGLGMPNAGGRQYYTREILAVRGLCPANLLFIAYPGDETQADRTRQEVTLCQELGITSPIVRVYRPTVWGLDPKVCAEEDAPLFLQYGEAGVSPEWVPWNEMNLEGWGEDWAAQIDYAKEYLRAFRLSALPASVFVHLPALSPTGNYQDGYTAYKKAGLASTFFDWIDRHVYNIAQLIELPAFCTVTEWNQLPARSLALNIPESFYFILDSADPAFWQYSLMRNPGLYQDFKTWARQGIGQPDPGKPSDLPVDDSHDETEGGSMNEYTRAIIFNEWKAVRDGAPAFQKCAAENLDLGGPIGPERDTASFRWQPYARGIIVAPIGQWGQTTAVIDPAGPASLPDFT